jgi:glycosyltransferase involved in cell wall biosynthesis
MKLTIVHLLTDLNVGGVMSSVNSLLRSRLAEKFNFLPMLTPKDLLSQPSQLKPKVKPDLIFVHDASSWRLMLTLLRLRWRSKLLIQEHHYSKSFEAINVPSKPRFRLMLKLAYSIANRVVVCSFAQRNWMLEHKLIDSQKITVIQQCRVLEDFLAVPVKALGARLVLGTYGRFSAQKGLDLLLKAMQMLPDLDVELRIGGYGEDEEMLRELVASDRRIQFVGKLEDVPKFLETCDLVVIPSRWEPWGNVCLESKAAGKPVIVTDVDGLAEQVVDCGLLIGANVEELKVAIAKVVNIHTTSPQTLLKWGAHGREAVRGAWGKYLMEWEALFWLSSNS